jgi:tetratricopeptide (TPR) repeat protein
LKKAKEHYQALARSSGTEAAGSVGLAETLWASGDKGDAIRAFEKAVSYAPGDLDLRLRVGEVYEGEKMVAEALHTYRKAHELAKANKRYAQTLAELSEKIELLQKLVQEPGAKKVSLREPAEQGTK